MNQEQLITKIKEAFMKVHKKLGVFQVGELDCIFGEPEQELESENKEESALEFIGKKTEEKKLGDVPLIKESLEPKGDDTNGKQ